IRALPLSATYTAPFDAWIAIPLGVWSSPLPEPGLPNVLTGLSNDACAVVAPSASVKAQAARAPAARRARSKRTRYQLPTKTAVRFLPATRSETRDAFIEIPLHRLWASRWPQLDWHVSSLL